jgi:hypothetical protein
VLAVPRGALTERLLSVGRALSLMCHNRPRNKSRPSAALTEPTYRTRKAVLIQILLLTCLLAYVLYRYHESQPPDQEQIDHCNQLVEDMPQDTREQINRSINTFMECLQD